MRLRRVDRRRPLLSSASREDGDRGPRRVERGRVARCVHCHRSAPRDGLSRRGANQYQDARLRRSVSPVPLGMGQSLFAHDPARRIVRKPALRQDLGSQLEPAKARGPASPQEFENLSQGATGSGHKVRPEGEQLAAQSQSAHPDPERHHPQHRTRLAVHGQFHGRIALVDRSQYRWHEQAAALLSRSCPARLSIHAAEQGGRGLGLRARPLRAPAAR